MHTLVNFSREPSTSSVEPFLMCVSQELGLIVYSSRRSYWRKIKKNCKLLPPNLEAVFLGTFIWSLQNFVNVLAYINRL